MIRQADKFQTFVSRFKGDLVDSAESMAGGQGVNVEVGFQSFKRLHFTSLGLYQGNLWFGQ